MGNETTLALVCTQCNGAVGFIANLQSLSDDKLREIKECIPEGYKVSVVDSVEMPECQCQNKKGGEKSE